jgi:hypothetical protein
MLMSISGSFPTRRWLTVLVLFTLVLGLGLALLRDARKDETLYLRESATMAASLRAGRWFGNEAVGVHGFLFKLPAALLFLAVGNSVYAATAVTVVLAAGCVLLCFRVLRRLLDSEPWALLGVWMLVTNFQFVRLMPTYNRDIPALLVVLLFIDALLSRRNRWVMGLLLLLLLDTKEYLFFMCLPAYGLWVVADEWMHRGARPVSATAGRIAARGAAAVLPAAVYAVLMACTGIVPLNMFLARILGLVDAPATNTVTAPFRPALATTNLWTGTTLAVPAAADTALAASPCACTAAVQTLLPYLGKLFYPSFFSFDGIPKPVALPALAMSVVRFARRRRERDTARMAPWILLWVFLGLLFMMASYPRYMQPVFPLLIAGFLLFVRDGIKRPCFAVAVLVATMAYAGVGLYFESIGLWKKIAVTGLMFGALWVAWALSGRRRGTPGLNPAPRNPARASAAVPLLFGALTLAISLWHTSTHPLGQVRNARLFGVNRECARVLDAIPEEARVWLNDAGWKYLPDVLTGQPADTPEWEGALKPWVPKKALLRHHPERRVHGFWYYDLFDLRKRIRENRLDMLALVVAEHETERFAYQRELKRFKTLPWLKLDKTVPMQNKTLYLFRYLEM